MKTVLLGVLAATLSTYVYAHNVTTSAEERLLSLDFRHPDTSTNLPEVCAKDAAWKAQFLCANRFYAHVEQVEDNIETESHDVCSSVSRFYICLDTVLHEQSCDHDAELMGPVEYFPRVLTHKYHKLCSAELGLTAQQLRGSARSGFL